MVTLEVEIKAGAKFDLLSPGEFHDGMTKAQRAADAAQEARGHALKEIRLPLVEGKAVSSVLNIGGDQGQQLATPASGYKWAIRHLVIEGLTAGTTPDVVNIVRNNRIIWQLNGNQFAQTWGRGEITLNAGETLTYLSVGTFASAATIVVHGMADEAPAQSAWKLFA